MKRATNTVVALRAARLIDQLEARGYIGAFDGSNARVVLRRESVDHGNGGDPGDD